MLNLERLQQSFPVDDKRFLLDHHRARSIGSKGEEGTQPVPSFVRIG